MTRPELSDCFRFDSHPVLGFCRIMEIRPEGAVLRNWENDGEAFLTWDELGVCSPWNPIWGFDPRYCSVEEREKWEAKQEETAKAAAAARWADYVQECRDKDSDLSW